MSQINLLCPCGTLGLWHVRTMLVPIKKLSCITHDRFDPGKCTHGFGRNV